jgi:hypothetical protein
MNEATFGKLDEYSIDDTLGISVASTFDLRCNFVLMRPLLFKILGFSWFVSFSTHSQFCAQAGWPDPGSSGSWNGLWL